MSRATVIKADLVDALTFVAVVEQGSFSSAARHLGIPKSSVSRRVSALEERLEAKLLQRTTRTLHLTDAGQGYFQRCRQAFEQLHAAEQCLDAMQAEPRGMLKVTAPSSFGYDFLGGMVEEYCSEHPDVQLIVELTNRFVDVVAEGFDVAIRAGAMADSSMVARRVLNDHMVLVASPAYLLAHGTPTRLEQLRKHRCLLFRSETTTATWSLNGPSGTESVRVEGYLVANELGLLESAAKRGLGIALLPGLGVRGAIECGQLAPVLPEYAGAVTPVSVVYPSASFLSPKTKAFVELALRRLQALADPPSSGRDPSSPEL